MKIAVVGTLTQSNLEQFLAGAFTELGHDVVTFDAWSQGSFLRSSRVVNTLSTIPRVRHVVRADYLRFLNRRANEFFEEHKPDFVIAHNGGEMLPQTVRSLTSKGVPFASFAADDPTLGFYVPDFLPVFPHFTHVFVPETGLVAKLQTLTAGKVVYNSGGSTPGLYAPVEPSAAARERFASNLGYASSAYSGGPYGVYRALWLAHVKDFGLRIFGDRNWRLVAQKVPEIAPCIHATGMLSLAEMNALYSSVRIYVNIVNPQITTGVAQRVFDAAAAGCFQITEYKADLDLLFPDGEIVSFRDAADLRNKVSHYLANPEAAAAKAHAARVRVSRDLTWKQKAQEICHAVFG
jgi:glycosyl transferase family 1